MLFGASRNAKTRLCLLRTRNYYARMVN